VETSDIDLRSVVKIVNNVIINKKVSIIRATHELTSEYYSTLFQDLIIEDYVWVCTGAVIMPQVCVIKKGTVVGAFSLLVKNTNEMSIVGGNPAIFVKKRQALPTKLVTVSLKERRFFVL